MKVNITFDVSEKERQAVGSLFGAKHPASHAQLKAWIKSGVNALVESVFLDYYVGPEEDKPVLRDATGKDIGLVPSSLLEKPTVRPRKPTVRPSDGNAFSVMGACAKAARRAGWKSEKWDAIQKDMMAGDYDHLLQVAMKHFDLEVDDDTK